MATWFNTFVSSSYILGSDSKKWADSKIAGEHFNIESPPSLWILWSLSLSWDLSDLLGHTICPPRPSLENGYFNVWATPLQNYWQSITLKFTVSSKTTILFWRLALEYENAETLASKLILYPWKRVPYSHQAELKWRVEEFDQSVLQL